MTPQLTQPQRSLLPRRVSLFVRYFLCLLMFTFSLQSYAAQAIATVSKNVVGVNEVFQLKVSIDDNVNTSSLDLSPLGEHFNYGTPSVSSGTSIVNGVVTRSTEWTVAVAAKEIGEWTIPSFRIGATETDPITITSLKSANSTNGGTAKPDIHLDFDIDKDSLYIGESIRYTVRIRIGEQLSQPTLIAPSGEGLEVKQNGDDRQTETVLNGKRYIIITRDYQITANKAGDILLRGAQFKGNVIKGSRGFGSTLRVPLDLQTQDITLAVTDKPADYKGLWLPTEDLVLEQDWQPQTETVKVGEPISRTITLKIKNAEQSTMPNLSLNYPSNVRVYDEKPIYGSDAGYTTMTVKQVIIARNEGNVSLPPLTINWWNTSTNRQESSKIEGFELSVQAGETGNNALPLQPAPDVAPTANQPTPQPVSTETSSNWWPWLSLVLFILWVGTIKLWLNERKKHPVEVADKGMKANNTITPVAGMLKAAKDDQPIQFQAYFDQWRAANPEHPSTTEVKAAIERYMQQQYSKSGLDNESTSTLITLLESLEKQNKVHKNTQQSALSPLVPDA
ncbi:BatD family protein [Photobacterium sanctipauli]|nr:BatD family protein [Photobacterium sanctipauli]